MKKLIKLFEILNENEIIKLIEINENKIIYIDNLNNKLTYIFDNNNNNVNIYNNENKLIDNYEINELFEIELTIYEYDLYNKNIIL